MKVLVTGGTGFIGSHLVDKLLAKNYDVRCLVRKTSNLRWLNGKNVKLVEASLFDAASLEELVAGVDYIYHVAGNVSAKNLEAYMQGNCQATINLIEAALKFTPNLQRFLFVSSQAAVGPALAQSEPSTVDTPLHPITDYGRSKAAAEESVQKYVGKLPFTIVRPPAVYGPRETEIYAIFKMIKLGIMPYMGFNKKILSIVNVFDLCDGIIGAAESRNALGKSYFISSEEFYE